MTEEKNFTYPRDVLQFLRNKLDERAISCFQLVVANNNSELGFLKTKFDEFKTQRRAMELAFTILEAQGFIEQRALGNMRPYFLTVRGQQLSRLLKEEGIE